MVETGDRTPGVGVDAIVVVGERLSMPAGRARSNGMARLPRRSGS
jgi:hypothetical protein